MEGVLLLSVVFMLGVIALLATGIPISVGFVLLGSAFLVLVRGPAALTEIADTAYGTVTSDTLITIPLFVLMGEILFASGMGVQLFEVTSKWLGRLPGGLAVASMLSNALFGSVCGSSVVSTATIGSVAYPEMTKRGYAKEFSAGILAVGGGVAILIPPSIPFVVYAMLTEQSVAAMFMAGVVPGLLLTAVPALYAVLYAWLHPDSVPLGDRVSWRERFRSIGKLWTVGALVLIVLISLYKGIASASEAGAMGAIGAFLITTLFMGTSLSKIWLAVQRSIRTTTFIALILIGANIINHAIAWSGLPKEIMNYVVYSGAFPNWAVIPAMCAVFFSMGMFMESLAVMLLILPSLLPTIKLLGVDPIWLGVVMVMNIEIALLTPPVGMNMYVIQGVSGLPMEKVMRGILPFIGLSLLCLAIVLAFPSLSLWLPNTMH